MQQSILLGRNEPTNQRNGRIEKKMSEHSHCRYLLHGARRFAKQHKVNLPTNIKAVRWDGANFAINADDVEKFKTKLPNAYFGSPMVEGDCRWEAKANFIYAVVEGQKTLGH